MADMSERHEVKVRAGEAEPDLFRDSLRGSDPWRYGATASVVISSA